MTNSRRADRAQIALDAYTDDDFSLYGEESLETRMKDLLIDLHHIAERHGLKMKKLVKRARDMYIIEHVMNTP